MGDTALQEVAGGGRDADREFCFDSCLSGQPDLQQQNRKIHMIDDYHILILNQVLSLNNHYYDIS